MKRQLTDGRRTFDLEWERQNGLYTFRHDGHEQRTASIIEVEPGIYSALLGTRSFEAVAVLDGDSITVHIGSRRYELRTTNPRSLSLLRGVATEGKQSVTARMPGKVVRVLVQEGDRVEEGQGIVVIEAMKMQNEMRAPKAGTIVSLPVQQAAVVAGGEILAVVE
jgi:biotin carboxyl carrier protein